MSKVAIEMFILLFSYLLSAENTIQLAEIAERPLTGKEVKLFNQHIGLVTNHFFYAWREDGSLSLSIRAQKDFRFSTWHYHRQTDLLMITAYKNDGAIRTFLYNRDGHLAGDVDFFGSRYIETGGQLFTFPIGAEPPHVPDGYPYLFVPIQLQEADGQYRITEHEPKIAKTPPLLHEFNLNYKRAWLIEQNGTYYVVNELQPKIYAYSGLDINLEKREGLLQPPTLAGQPLDLADFRPMTAPFSPPKKVYTKAEFQTLHWNWGQSHSLITGFERLGDGYLIAYAVADCEKNGDCRQSLLALQKLDAAFQPVGEPRIQPGIFAGVRDGQIYVLQFERRLTLPVPEPPYYPRLLLLPVEDGL